VITIKDTLVDLVGDADWDPKAYAEIWSTDELRDVSGNTVTDKRLQIPITAEGLETLPLSPGTAFIRLHLGTLRPSLGPYAITIPDATGERRIVELRTELPPNADPPTTIDATRVNGLPAAIEEVGNGIYAPQQETYKQLARTPDLLIAGTITRNSNEAAISAPVVWPDGTPGTYTATALSASFPGAVDAYTITYGSPVTKTYTQPAVTRNAAGAATAVPAIVVS
jgi:hypothetical protein